MATARSSETLIFAKPDGGKVTFFLETSVRDKSKLLRTISKHGGTLVHEASKADILFTERSKELVKAWGKDKVILDTCWIYQCLKAQRFIGENESWGGCDLRDCQFGNADEDRDESESERESDVFEQNASQAKIAQSRSFEARAVHTGNGKTRNLSQPVIKTSDSPPPPKKRRLEEPPDPVFSQTQTEAPYGQHVLQYGVSSQSHVTPHYAAAPSTLAFPQPSQDISTALGRVLASPQFAPLLNSAIQHILSQESNISSEGRTQLGDFFTSTPALDFPSQHHWQMPPSTQPEVINSSTSRCDTTPPDPTSPRSIDGGQSTIVIQQYPQRAVSHSSSRLSTPPSDDDNQDASISSTRIPTSDIQLTKGFFTLSNEVGYKFYIDMRLKNRKELVRIVKRNGGEIVSVMGDADYVVLNNRSPTFSLVANLVPLDKIVVSAGWLTECAEQNDLVSPDPYRIQVASRTSSPKKRKEKTPSLSQKTSSSNDYQTKSHVSTPSESTPDKFKPSPPGTRSPSPPADFVLYSENKYAFTQAEKEWFLRYMRFRWKQDPNISNNALLNAITRKAPHHPKSSWSNAFATKWAAEVQALRKEMNLPV